MWCISKYCFALDSFMSPLWECNGGTRWDSPVWNVDCQPPGFKFPMWHAKLAGHLWTVHAYSSMRYCWDLEWLSAHIQKMLWQITVPELKATVLIRHK